MSRSKGVIIEIRRYVYADASNDFERVTFKTKTKTHVLTIKGFDVMELQDKFKAFIIVHVGQSTMNESKIEKVCSYYLTNKTGGGGVLSEIKIPIGIARRIWEYLEDSYKQVG